MVGHDRRGLEYATDGGRYVGAGWARTVATSVRGYGGRYTGGGIDFSIKAPRMVEQAAKTVQQANVELALGSADLARRTLWSLLQGNRTNFGLSGVWGGGVPMWSGEYAEGFQVQPIGVDLMSTPNHVGQSLAIDQLYAEMLASPLVPESAKNFYRTSGDDGGPGYFRREVMLAYTRGRTSFPKEGLTRDPVAAKVVKREKDVMLKAVQRARTTQARITSHGFSVMSTSRLRAKHLRKENLPATRQTDVNAALNTYAFSLAEKITNTIKRDLAKLGAK